MTDVHDFDRTLAGWLHDAASPAPPALLASVTTATRSRRQRPRPIARALGARTWPSSERGLPLARLLLVAGILAAAALAGVLATAGERQTPPPAPSRPAVQIPGFRLLTHAGAGVSIQVPAEWTREIADLPTRQQLMGAAMGHGGVRVYQLTERGLLADVADALLEPEISGGGEVLDRVSGPHGSHSAIRVRLGTSIYYLVERSPSERFLVQILWDTVPDLGVTTEQILGSFNITGTQPELVAPLPASTDGRTAPPSAAEGMLPGYRLLSDAAAGVSFQVPETWTREPVSARRRPGFLIGGGWAFGEVALYRVTQAGSLDEVMDAFVAELPDAQGMRSRSEGLHDGHPAMYETLERSRCYLVERSADERFLLSIAWYAPDSLGVTDQILRSLNVDGPEAAVTEVLQ